MDEECEKFSNSKSSASGCCLVFAWFFAIFSLALLKVLLTNTYYKILQMTFWSQMKTQQNEILKRFNYHNHSIKKQRESSLSNSYVHIKLPTLCFPFQSSYILNIHPKWKVSLFRVFLISIFPHSDWVRRDCGVSLHSQSKCGKILTRKTPNTDTFHAVKNRGKHGINMSLLG